MAVRIGTSGWVYSHWRGIFYPPDLPPAEWLAHYTREFDTVEINNSFYRLPSEATFDAWRAQAPPGFVFAVKASRFLTHLKKLKDPEEPLATFFARTGRLAEKLGPVLYQLPPHWRVDPPRFARFLAALPKGYRHVVEFRDESWFVEEVFRLMERHGVAHCLHDMPPLSVPLRVTAPFVYLRFHGDPAHGGRYPEETLARWAKRIGEWQREGLDIYVYFNNDWGGHAVADARTLRRLV
ncbi:MAG: DUF72 domain-containing protein [Bacillota bacterium]